MGRRARRRYRAREALAANNEHSDELAAEADEMQRETERLKTDPEYAAYLESLGEDAERMDYLESLGEDAEPKEKVTWRWKDDRKDNWHDYLACFCHVCTDFRKVNGIERWKARASEIDPWAEPLPDEDTDT